MGKVLSLWTMAGAGVSATVSGVRAVPRTARVLDQRRKGEERKGKVAALGGRVGLLQGLCKAARQKMVLGLCA